MGNVLWWSVVLIGLILLAFIAAAQVKKRFLTPDDTAGAGFTLADLRALHRDGKMTDAEFVKAKQVMLGAAPHGPDRRATGGNPQPPASESNPPPG